MEPKVRISDMARQSGLSAATVSLVLNNNPGVSQDVSIVGYDDTYIAARANPALTTMRVDTLAMGRAAVHLLSLRLDHPESARMTVTIHPTLVERDSVLDHQSRHNAKDPSSK